MLILDHRSGAGQLPSAFAATDAGLASLERCIADGRPLPLASAVEQAMSLVRRLLTAYVADAGRKSAPAAETELLDVFKVLVKGEPSWNAIRDNCRELVYYRNCINMGREDALPVAAEKMAVRTARHIFLYVKTRCLRERRLAD